MYIVAAVRKDNTTVLHCFTSEGKAVKYADRIIKDFEYVDVLRTKNDGFRIIYSIFFEGQGFFREGTEYQMSYGPTPIG